LGIENIEVTQGEEILSPASPAKVRIELVVGTRVIDQVLSVDAAAEPLKAIIVREADLHMVNFGTPTDTTHGQTVDFVVQLKAVTWELDAGVFKNTAVVVAIGTTEFVLPERIGGRIVQQTTLDIRARGGLISWGSTEDDDATPIPTVALARRLHARENHGAIGFTHGEDFAAPHDHDRSAFVALDHRAGLKVQFCTVVHIVDAGQSP